MSRIVRDIQLLVNDDDDHLYGYRLSDGTEVRIGTSQTENAAAVVGAAGGLVRRNTIVYLGDSQTSRSEFSAGTATLAMNLSWKTWFEGFSSYALTPLNMAATEGHTTAQMYARMDTDVLPYNPGWLAVMGGLNDLLAGSSAQDVIAQLTLIFNKARFAGVKVVACTIYPVGSGSIADTEAIQLAILDVNKWLHEYASTTGNIIVADTWAALVDRTSESTVAAADMLGADGIHTGAKGARNAGAAVWAAISSQVVDNGYHIKAQSDSYGTNAANKQMSFNPLFQGSVAATSPVTGTVATGVTVERGAGTPGVAASVVARSDGFGNSQRMVITSSADNDTVQMVLLLYTAGLSLGDVLEGEVFVDVASATALKGLNLTLQVTTDEATYTTISHAGDATVMDQSNFSTVMRPDVLTIPSSGTIIFAALIMQAKFSGAGGATIDVGRSRCLRLE